MSTTEVIRIVGAEHNNLKHLSLDIPLNELLVITGVSGSGKSSLAFDTLYAEGQRRYVESFSAYARQFLERMDKPQVEAVEGIPPAIAIDQSNPVKNARSTVGTMTELTDHVRLLFAKMGQLHCRQCGEPVQRTSASGIVETLARHHGGRTVMISFPFDAAERTARGARLELQRLGFTRLLVGGKVVRLDAGAPAGPTNGALEVVVDRVSVQAARRARLLDSLQQAMRFGQGRVSVHLPQGEPLRFSQQLHCPDCDLSYRDPVPNLFSFNSPLGACQTCQGFGRTIDIDLDLIIPDRRKSLAQGAVKPWSTQATRRERRILMDFCADHGIPTDVPFAGLEAAQQAMIIDGHGAFFGLRGWFAWLETRTYRMHVRIFLARYRSYVTCHTCHGTRLQPEALLTRIRGRTISDVYALPVGACAEFFTELAASAAHDEAVTLLLGEIRSRLGYLVAVGLDYLTLDRQSRTLSGGEVQRVNLTTALGSSLVNTLYILDEPSIGLHPRDSRRLVDILHRLKANRNTIVVVEHDPEIIRESDRVLDLGPGAGERGGEVVYVGPPGDMATAPGSLTGQYLDGRRRVPVPTRRRRPRKGHAITIRGASQNNLKDVDVRIPLGVLVCVTGVSGSGKSTLVHEVLYNGLQKARGMAVGAPGACRELAGGDAVDAVALVDQAPVGRTPRANPATYVKAWDHVRRLFAGTPAARERGLSASTFSFNTAGGRCETCQGSGFEKIDMQFLSDIFVTCPDCDGARFRREVLEVTYKDRTIAEVLQLTVAQAMSFFDDTPALCRTLQALQDVGLDYVRLGQPLNTLSGGESQRLKLAFHMGQDAGGRRLLIFDEPTTGLHFHDIATLLRAFDRLLAQGHSLLVIEHNMEVVKSADYLIDLGPEGGEAGGRLVATGTPEQVSRCAASHTGRFLGPYLKGGADAYRLRRPQGEPPAAPAVDGAISINGARHHNLKNIELDIPRDRFVVVTGLSGSGKINPGLRHRLRRGTAALHGQPVGVRAAVPAAAQPAGRGQRARRAADRGHRAAGHPRRPQLDGGDGDRGAPLPAAAVRQGGRAALPDLRPADHLANRRADPGAPADGLPGRNGHPAGAGGARPQGVSQGRAGARPAAGGHGSAGGRRHPAAGAAAAAGPLPRARHRRGCGQRTGGGAPAAGRGAASGARPADGARRLHRPGARTPGAPVQPEILLPGVQRRLRRPRPAACSRSTAARAPVRNAAAPGCGRSSTPPCWCRTAACRCGRGPSPCTRAGRFRSATAAGCYARRSASWGSTSTGRSARCRHDSARRSGTATAGAAVRSRASCHTAGGCWRTAPANACGATWRASCGRWAALTAKAPACVHRRARCGSATGRSATSPHSPSMRR